MREVPVHPLDKLREITARNVAAGGAIYAITPRKCVACDAWRAESETEAVTLDPDTLYVCDQCVEDAEGPGRFERSADALTLALHSLSLDGEDFFLTDDWQGYIGQFGRHVLTIDHDGFVESQSFTTPEKAYAWIAGVERDGFGANEDDAWISYEPRGLEVSFAGEHIGTFKTLRRARAAVSVEMRKQGYFPNVWLAGEHGPSVRMIDVW